MPTFPPSLPPSFPLLRSLSIFDNLDLLASNFPLNTTDTETFKLTTLTVTIKRQPAADYSGDTFSTTSADVQLPQTLLGGLTITDLRLSYSAFENAALFTPRQPKVGVSVGATVISASVVDELVDNLVDPVQLSFSKDKVSWCDVNNVLSGVSV